MSDREKELSTLNMPSKFLQLLMFRTTISIQFNMFSITSIFQAYCSVSFAFICVEYSPLMFACIFCSSGLFDGAHEGIAYTFLAQLDRTRHDKLYKSQKVLLQQ